jgi:hypothetical protein
MSRNLGRFFGWEAFSHTVCGLPVSTVQAADTIETVHHKDGTLERGTNIDCPECWQVWASDWSEAWTDRKEIALARLAAIAEKAERR